MSKIIVDLRIQSEPIQTSQFGSVFWYCGLVLVDKMKNRTNWFGKRIYAHGSKLNRIVVMYITLNCTLFEKHYIIMKSFNIYFHLFQLTYIVLTSQ